MIGVIASILLSELSRFGIYVIHYCTEHKQKFFCAHAGIISL